MCVMQFKDKLVQNISADSFPPVLVLELEEIEEEQDRSSEQLRAPPDQARVGDSNSMSLLP